MSEDKLLFNETCKVYYLKETDIVQLGEPLIIDLSMLIYGRLVLTTSKIYPIRQFINIELNAHRGKFSLIGKVNRYKRLDGGLFEIDVMLESIPESLLSEFQDSMLESLL